MNRKFTNLSNSELIIVLQSGNELAVKELYKRCNFNMVKKMILNLGGNSEDAKDIFQEAVIALYKLIMKGEFELIEEFGGFVYSVSRKIWYKRFNSQKRYVFDELISIRQDTEGNIFDFKFEKKEELAKIKELFLLLSETCRKILELYYIKEFSMDAIAHRLKLKSEKVAKQMKYKCLKNLKFKIK